MRIASVTVVLAWVAVAAGGCDVGVPAVHAFGTVVPHLTPPNETGARGIPSIEAKALAEGEAQSDSCQEWSTDYEHYTDATGAFEVAYSCAEGGEVARVLTQGVDNGDGSGHYSTVYQLRNGSEVTWEFNFRPDPVEPGATVYTGSSSQGGGFEGEYRELANGLTELREVYAYPDHVFVVEGLSDDEGRFNGSVSYDDLGTEISPDWTLVQVEQHDGTIQQTIDSTTDGWGVREKLTALPDGSLRYEFRYDDLGTEVFPDYQGQYDFSPAGTGQGDYTQNYADGSTLTVHQDIEYSGAYRETWVFDDELTAQPKEQEGELHYDLGGHATGTITTYVVGGSAETCDLEVFTDGSTIIDNCRG
ncbi:MAG: hypothetical protein ABIJ09_15850 [Pseudomonadota bacterium]